MSRAPILSGRTPNHINMSPLLGCRIWKSNEINPRAFLLVRGPAPISPVCTRRLEGRLSYPTQVILRVNSTQLANVGHYPSFAAEPVANSVVLQIQVQCQLFSTRTNTGRMPTLANSGECRPGSKANQVLGRLLCEANPHDRGRANLA